MKKSEIIKDILELFASTEFHPKWAEEAAEKIYDKYIGKSTEGTGSISANDNYCKACGGLLPHVGWWASGAEPVRCSCKTNIPETKGTCQHWNIPVTTVQKCPVCEGRGLLPYWFYSTHPYGVTTSCSDVVCRSCNGTGIIKI